MPLTAPRAAPHRTTPTAARILRFRRRGACSGTSIAATVACALRARLGHEPPDRTSASPRHAPSKKGPKEEDTIGAKGSRTPGRPPSQRGRRASDTAMLRVPRRSERAAARVLPRRNSRRPDRPLPQARSPETAAAAATAPPPRTGRLEGQRCRRRRLRDDRRPARLPGRMVPPPRQSADPSPLQPGTATALPPSPRQRGAPIRETGERSRSGGPSPSPARRLPQQFLRRGRDQVVRQEGSQEQPLMEAQRNRRRR